MKIKIDSRKVSKGDTFVAVRGVDHNGHDFIDKAIENGAIKIVAEQGTYAVETEIVPSTRDYLTAYLTENVYDEIKDLKLIGVTGTNGKTTTCFLLYEALNQLNAKCGYIGTIGFYIDGKVRDLKNTTPDIIDLYEMLLECKEKGCTHVTMEVSSHALSYGRIDSLLFDIVLYTNLTRDHLDYHKTMENYALAKQKLFHKIKKGGKAFINADDPYKEYFILEENENIFYGFTDSNYRVTGYEITDIKNMFYVKKEDHIYYFESALIGKYNIYNMLSTIAILMELGYVDLYDLIMALKAPIGRMDQIQYNENTIIIDYAHTPDAVENIINSAREIAKGKIYTIVGCGGNRDKTKRPVMAKIATDLSDAVIFTSDNPRYENPSDILDDMVYKLDNQNYEIIENRKEAIKKGIQILTKNDILLLLGKGHENYQVINGEKHYFDDKQIVLEYM